ncbi:hypothetical protein CGSMWGv1500E_05773 [Gardnerella vaginalis 1500E]|uniref:Uncharacterized protein n=1 Tax=Gardnerella vaginalis 1500E TaxID=698957 RepID=I4LXN1_GARVA|nr:hypothetical protein CGSMWGv1500E_05773 [Gardnerella vaginalis 1500E]EIK88006.1 hypothetical protein CGSMWGv6119V5_00642 [Gardnerella vaginalis 6119V5]
MPYDHNIFIIGWSHAASCKGIKRPFPASRAKRR